MAARHAARDAAVAYPASALKMWEEMEHNTALLPTGNEHCKLGYFDTPHLNY